MLPIAPSTDHAHVAQRADPAKVSPRARQDEVLMGQIRRVHEANFGVYGARKVWRQLGREGVAVARCAVERLMRLDLQGAVRGKEVRTTIGNTTTPCPTDKVNRQFRAPQPNRLLCLDLAGLRLRCLRHRCVCPSDRRLARVADGPCRVRA